jgi:thermostable 8-oxoguanine DNA glycosylase
MQISLEKIKSLLFENPEIRKKIERDYNFYKTPENIDEFSSLLISSLNQPVKDIYRDITNSELFEAAVKSLGSNSRAWSVFISSEPELREVLFHYNPAKVYENRMTLKRTLRDYFPGQTCTNDVRAILLWAEKLTRIENYYSRYIKEIVKSFESLHKHLYNEVINKELLFICVAGFFANPPSKWIGEKFLSNINLKEEYSNLKFEGMGYPLTSEFLRNLGWNGFKPDRHIKRLFQYWFDCDNFISQQEINRCFELIGRKNKDLGEFIKYSLIGYKISPQNIYYSEVDNFIWALGAYVIKKGKENNYDPKDFYNIP